MQKPDTNCLRCGKPCRTGTPAPESQAIMEASKGYCTDCMVTRFLLGIESVRNMVEGTPASGRDLVAARRGLGPQAFRLPHIQQAMNTILNWTQLSGTRVDWEQVIEKWNLPWPKTLMAL
jgi:hypothetical protein